jgi:hypothetical protein
MGIKEWVQNIILKKAVRSGVGVVVAFLCSGVIASELQKYGVTINKAELEIALMALIGGGIEALRAWLKNKYKINFL